MSEIFSDGPDEDDQGEMCFSDSLPPGGIRYHALNLFLLVINHLSFGFFPIFEKFLHGYLQNNIFDSTGFVEILA